MANEQRQAGPQGVPAQVRAQGLQGDCGCPPNKADPKGGAPVAVSDTPSNAGSVNLSERELLIYQAGQAFGAAQALRQSAEAVNGLSQKLNANATQQAKAGQELLDRALGIQAPKGQATATGARLGTRVVRAAAALLGADD